MTLSRKVLPSCEKDNITKSCDQIPNNKQINRQKRLEHWFRNYEYNLRSIIWKMVTPLDNNITVKECQHRLVASNRIRPIRSYLILNKLKQMFISRAINSDCRPSNYAKSRALCVRDKVQGSHLIFSSQHLCEGHEKKETCYSVKNEKSSTLILSQK